jgi:hypothetical protein
MLRPFGPALSLIYADASRALSRKQDPPVDYIAARYGPNYTHAVRGSLTPLIVGNAKYLGDAFQESLVHRRMLEHYQSRHEIRERFLILDTPTTSFHVTITQNEGADTLVLRTELVA